MEIEESPPDTTKPGDKKMLSAASKSRREKYPPSCFTDDVGNLKFVNLVVRHPCKIFFVILLLNLALTFLLFQVVFAGGNPFSDPGSQYDPKDVRSIAQDSLKLAREEVDSLLAAASFNLSNAPTVRMQERNLDITYWVYEGESEDGVFGSAESIRGMRESLSLFLDDPNYDSYCMKDYTTEILDDNSTLTTSKCRPPLSALNMYYATSWDEAVADSIMEQLSTPGNVERYNTLSLCVEFDILCDLIPTLTNYTDDDLEWTRDLNEQITSLTDDWDGAGELLEDNLEQVTLLAAHLMQLNTKRGFVDFGFDKNFAISNPVSMFSRAIVLWGGPLNETLTANIETTTEENDEDDEDSQNDRDQKALKEYFLDNFLDEMNDISDLDRNPNVNSFYFMGILILEVLLDIVTRDAMLALASFMFVFLYLRLMVGSWFLAIVGMAEILLSVPVSWFLYDTVFQIKYFAFLNTLCLYIVAAIGADDIFIFMDAYKQSAHHDDPEVLESLESRMSWVYRRTGSAMAITSATTCAAFLCTLITPLVDIQAFGIFAAIVIFIDYALVMTLFCTAVVIYHNKFEKPGCFASCLDGCRTTEPSPTTKALENIHDPNRRDEDKIGQFFRNKVSPFINTAWHRVVIGVVFVAWLGLAGYSVSKLEPTQEAEQFLSDDHPLQRSVTIINDEFETAQDDPGLDIFFVWGLDDVNRDGVRLLFKPDFFGEPTFVDEFEFNEKCQTALLSSCSDVRLNPDYSAHIQQEAGRGSVSCFIEEFAAYSVLGTLRNCQDVALGAWRNQNWQVDPADISEMMDDFLAQRSCLSEEGESIATRYKNTLGWDGSKVRFAGFSLESSVVDPFSTLPEGTVRTEYDKMLEIAEALDTTVKEACGSDVVMTDLEAKFVFMNNQRIYARTALQSSLLGIGIAFTVLLLATRVFHIALFATFSIASVLVSVAGGMVLIGWTLGSIESVLISIVAGFSVDYVVHLSHSYVVASGSTYERITAAFGEMGISVLNGMVTSVGASIPLFFCQLTFFRKFGTFLCFTIAFSWLFANLGFMSLVAQLKIPIKKGENDRKKPEERVESAQRPVVQDELESMSMMSFDSEVVA